MAINVELLNQIKARILAEPNAFRMDEWNCGSAQCIAGWACSLAGREWIEVPVVHPMKSKQLTLKGHEDASWQWAWPIIAEEARALLDIDFEASQRLFLDDCWPEDLRDKFEEAGDHAGRAAVAAERIDRFIAAAGVEDYELDSNSDDDWDWDPAY